MLSASMCLRTSTCCRRGTEGQGEIWDPMGGSPSLGLVAHGTGSHTRCVPAQRGPPQKQGAPLTLRSMASALGRSKERAAREQRAQPPPAPRGSHPARAVPNFGVTSEPFQEEIIVLGGQGGQHVLHLLPELQGQEGQLVKGSLILPRNLQGWRFVPSLSP